MSSRTGSDISSQAIRLLQEVIDATKKGWVEQDEDSSISCTREGKLGVAARPTRQTAAEQIQDQPQAKSLVSLWSSEGEYASTRLGVEYSRISGWSTGVIDQPSFGSGLFLLELSPDF